MLSNCVSIPEGGGWRRYQRLIGGGTQEHNKKSGRKSWPNG